MSAVSIEALEPFVLLETPETLRVFRRQLEAAPVSCADDLERLLGPDTAYRVVAFDYELGHSIEPRSGDCASGAVGTVWRFAECDEIPLAECDAYIERHVAVLPADARAAAVADLAIGLDEAAYVAGVARIQRWIADGDCYQVNYSFPLHLRTIGHPLALYAALRRRQRGLWSACILTAERRILSCSPELFVAKRGDELACRPMKGTRPRSADAARDAGNRAELDAAEKDRAENVMIVDLLRNDLGRVAVPGSVRVDRLFEIESYPTVHQLVSSIRAKAPGRRMPEIVRALFPCGSITGAPKLRAMQIIGALETAPRGIYTGAIGCLMPDDDFTLNVAIRTLDLEAGGRARLGVGSGIVADSVPADEYRECLLKGEFATGLPAPFSLIETLRLENGALPRLAGHLARLADSARRLGFRYPAYEISAALQARAAENPLGVFRLRLLLAPSGSVSTTVQPLVPLGDDRRITLADGRLDSADWGLRFKTTRRARYDEALRRLPPEVFDSVFLNERDELCEGARSNLFLLIEGRLLTPAVDCGLLPGVLRAELLASGRAAEAVLGLDDLRRAEAIYAGNALHGLISVTLATDS